MLGARHSQPPHGHSRFGSADQTDQYSCRHDRRHAAGGTISLFGADSPSFYEHALPLLRHPQQWRQSCAMANPEHMG